MNSKPMQWHNTMAIMKINLIHKPGYENMMSAMLNRWEDFQALSNI
jgi:hypothetical protein